MYTISSFSLQGIQKVSIVQNSRCTEEKPIQSISPDGSYIQFQFFLFLLSLFFKDGLLSNLFSARCLRRGAGIVPRFYGDLHANLVLRRVEIHLFTVKSAAKLCYFCKTNKFFSLFFSFYSVFMCFF